MKKKPPGQGKTRTREHVIADLAVNYVERRVLLCGHTIERSFRDYGIDLTMRTFNELGEPENGSILIQVKSTDHLQVAKDGMIRIRIDRADLKHWLTEAYPLMLVVYDAVKDRAYWLYVQDYFEKPPISGLFAGTVTVRIPARHRLNRWGVGEFVRFRNRCKA